MTRNTFRLQKQVFILITVMLIVASQAYAQEPQTPLITNVQVSPDQKQIVIKADKALGVHSAFAFQNPCRLVIDFENTGLGRVPVKIKVDKPPINEIRLGNNGHRARLVVDFGEYPVPPFMVERKGNLAVVALGSVSTDPRVIQRKSPTEPGPSLNHIPGAQSEHRFVPKKESGRASVSPPAQPSVSSVAPSKKSEKQGFVVKQSLVSNNLLLVELQDRKIPTETYRIVVDLNLSDMTVRNASISNSNGIVKRFDLTQSDAKLAQEGPRQQERFSGPAATGPTKNVHPIDERPEGRRKYSWGSGNTTPLDVGSSNRQLENSNPFKLEKLELKSKNPGTAKLEN